MGRPSKPISVIKGEKKSHRTKAEIKKRQEAEQGLLTGEKLKESQEVKDNIRAHKEFQKINKLFKNISKNDNIYGSVINRYCLMSAECFDMEEKRENIFAMIQDMKIQYDELLESDELKVEEKARYTLEFADSMARLSGTLINYDKQIMKKRSMLLSIEKENIMTVASALRSIPKGEGEKKESSLMRILGGGEA